ncbi:hypothetical protein NQ318_009995, partial [Aromia moschata]
MVDGVRFVCRLFAIINIAQCARILGVFQMPSVSHQCVFRTLWKELSLRGHEVTVVTPAPLRDPSLTNLTEIDVSYTFEIMRRHGFQFFMSKELPVHTKIMRIFDLNYELSEAMFQDEEFIKIYNDSKTRFDLIIAQTYISPIMYSLSAKLGAPIIGISSMGGWIGSHFALGNPNPPALYSEMFLHYNGKLTFCERFRSAAYNLWARFFLAFDAFPKCNEIIRKYLGNDMPHVRESERNLSLLFLTTNPVLYTPRPTVPTIIPIQQLHVKPARPLPTDLQAILDNAKEGLVFFSLGSNVKSIYMPDNLRNTLIQTFAELPYKVLWKWESDDLPGKPENVIIRQWLPQQDVLAHPNIKVFITQCGLQSVEESIVRGVPMVGIPFIADQTMNIKRLVEYGVAIGIDYITVTKDELKSAIVEVATDKKYKENVIGLRELLQDEPMSPLDKALWWTEYVIRHKGTKHLRSPTADVTWIEYLLLDVLLVVIISLGIIVYAVMWLMKKIINICNIMDIKKKTKLIIRTDIKRLGRPIPDLIISKIDVGKPRNYSRNFNSSVYDRFKWLCGCPKRHKQFCFICLLMGVNQSAWTQKGVLGKVDIRQQLDSAYRENIRRHNENVDKHRHILNQIINCI